MPEFHAPFGGSSCHVWIECPASAYLSAVVERSTNHAAERGTAMHDAADRVFRNLPVEWKNYAADEKALVEAYVAEVNLIEADYRDYERWVGDSLCGGTIDAVLESPKGLFVIDLKTGKHDVNPVGNKQLMFYASAYLGFMAPIRPIHLGIYQPSISAQIRWWEPTVDEMLHLTRRIKKAAASNEFVVGNHCQQCKAFGVCWKVKSSMGKLSSSVAKDW